jgi:uncharacterized protein (TIGR03437 family)
MFGGSDISIAPSEIITIFGEQFPQQLSVTVSGRPLEILYSGTQQINAVVPNDMPLGETIIAVDASGTTLGPWPAEVAPVVPALFTPPEKAPSGIQARIAASINEDKARNSWEHPARAGNVVELYATGLGRLTDGKPLRLLTEHLEAYGPGGPGGGMEILYAGEAPDLPGVQQVNVRIGPRYDSHAPVAVRIRLLFDLDTANGERTEDNVAIFVQ